MAIEFRVMLDQEITEPQTINISSYKAWMKASIKESDSDTDSKLHFDIRRGMEFLSLYIIFNKVIG